MSEIRKKHIKFIEDMHKRIQDNFIKDGFLAPVAFIISYNGKIGVIGCDGFGCAEHKDLFVKAIKDTALETKAVGVMFASESWLVAMNDKNRKKMQKAYDKADGDLGKVPERQEIILVYEEYLDGAMQTKYDVKRGEKITLVAHKPQELDSKTYEGKFTNLLNRPNFDEMLVGR
jgi:hypothetical protein